VKEPVQSAERAWFARVVFDNYPLKLLALAFAVALFSLVHSGQDAQRSVYVDVVALMPPTEADMILVSTLPARVKVTLRGARARVAAVGHNDITPVQMDLREPGRRFYYFDPAAIGVSGPLRVVSVEPSSVQLAWRPRVDRSIGVRAKLSGTPAAGYAIRQPVEIVPSTVTVSGPKEEIEVLTVASTEDINIDGLAAGTHERRARLEPLSGHVAYAAQSAVLVRLEVEAETSERTFSNLEVAAIGPGNVTLRPGSVRVTLRGPAHQLKSVATDQLVPFVESAAGAAPSGAESLPVRLRGMPDSCSLVKIEPDSVLVRHER
jgi:YbbR domain-containing protein